MGLKGDLKLLWPGKKDEPDLVESVCKYIDRAGKKGVQSIVFPEYLLGRFKVPSPQDKYKNWREDTNPK